MSAAQSSIRKPLIGFSLFAVAALLLTYIIYSTLERSVPGDTGLFTTYFRDASGLAEGDDVRMAGVRVGRVDTIDLDNGRAKVTFSVRDDQPMYTTTQAAIRYQNLIGQRYLALDRITGDSSVLAAGSTLQQPAQDSFDVTKLLAGFQPVFETLTPEQVNRLSTGLMQAFQGDSVSLSTTVAQVGEMAADMANRDVVIGAIIDNLSGVLHDLSRQGAQVTALLQGVAGVVESLNANSAALGRSVREIGETAAGFADVLTRTRGDVASAATLANRATRALIGDGARLDRAAVDLPEFLGHLPLVIGEGAYLNIYVCDLDVAIGDILFPPGFINKIGGTQHSVVCR
ncbi:MAG: MlaD family protein [Gordonia sp. (in: high G+C Gram-positive bacteria)]